MHHGQCLSLDYSVHWNEALVDFSYLWPDFKVKTFLCQSLEQLWLLCYMYYTYVVYLMAKMNEWTNPSISKMPVVTRLWLLTCTQQLDLLHMILAAVWWLCVCREQRSSVHSATWSHPHPICVEFTSDLAVKLEHRHWNCKRLKQWVRVGGWNVETTQEQVCWVDVSPVWHWAAGM